MPAITIDDARAAKQRALEVFRALADVVGIGITRIGEGYGLKVNLRQPPEGGVALPDKIDRVPIRIEIVGTIAKR